MEAFGRGTGRCDLAVPALDLLQSCFHKLSGNALTAQGIVHKRVVNQNRP